MSGISNTVLASNSKPTYRQISTCDVLNRLAGGLTFVGLFILESGGYTPIRSDNTTSHSSHHGNEHDLSSQSIAHIRGLHCFFPAVCVAVAGLCLHAYPLNRQEHIKLVKAISALEAAPVVVELDQDSTPPANDVNPSLHLAVFELEQQAFHSSSKVDGSMRQLEQDSASYRAQPLDNSETFAEQLSKSET